jgi:uncharacterized protein (UPF0248 family)
MHCTAKKNPLVELLERIKWTMPVSEQERIAILLRHRGAIHDIKVLHATDIVAVSRGYLIVHPFDDMHMPEGVDTIPIPFHRVLKVIDERDENVLYDKLGTKEDI